MNRLILILLFPLSLIGQKADFDLTDLGESEQLICDGTNTLIIEYAGSLTCCYDKLGVKVDCPEEFVLGNCEKIHASLEILDLCVKSDTLINFYIGGGECLFDEQNPIPNIGDEVCYTLDDITDDSDYQIIPNGLMTQTPQLNSNTICWSYDGTNGLAESFDIHFLIEGQSVYVETVEMFDCFGGGGDTEITVEYNNCMPVCIDEDKVMTGISGNAISPSDLCNDCSATFDLSDYLEDELIDFEVRELCRFDDEAINGINGLRWDSEGNAADHNNTGAIFDDWSTHINGVADEIVVITNNWALSDNDFPLTGAYTPPTDIDISSQELYYATIYVHEPMTLNDNNGNHGEQISFYLQDCNKDMIPKYQTEANTNGVTRGIGDFVELCEGIYKIAFQVSDFSVFGGINLRYTTDGGLTYTSFPMSQTFASQPNIITEKVYCYADGSMTYPDGREYTYDPISCDFTCYPLSREPFPDVEINLIQACDDIDGDPANYVPVTLEVVTTDSEQDVTVWTNYGDDENQAEYTPSGGLVDCATGEPIVAPPIVPNCEDVEFIYAYTATGNNGVNVEKWITNAITGEPASTEARDIFNGDIDFSGMPSHDNGLSDAGVVVENDLNSTDGNNGQDQWRYWTYLYTAENIRLREHRGTAESIDYYLGECCISPTLVASGDYLNNDVNNVAFDRSLDAGIHYIGGTVFDFSVWSGINYQYSTDNGVTWSNVPAGWLYTDKPSIDQCLVKACIDQEGNALLTDAETGELLSSEFTLKSPQLCSGQIVPTSELSCALSTFYKVTATVGGIEQTWIEEQAYNSSSTLGDSYLLSFSDTDAEGLPAHINPATSSATQNLAQTTNVNNPAIADQAQTDGWIWLQEGTILREFNRTSEAVGIYISDACGSNFNEVLDATYTNTVANDLGYYPAGFYRVRVYSDDAGSSGIGRIQAQNANGVYASIPLYAERPLVEEVKGWVCDDGNFYSLDKEEVLDQEEWSCDNPSSCGSGSTTSNTTSTSLRTLRID